MLQLESILKDYPTVRYKEWGFIPEYANTLEKRTLSANKVRAERQVYVVMIDDREVFLHIYPDTGIVGDYEFEGEHIDNAAIKIAQHGIPVYYWEQVGDEVKHFVLY